jgi:hypothetical protein
VFSSDGEKPHVFLPSLYYCTQHHANIKAKLFGNAAFSRYSMFKYANLNPITKQKLLKIVGKCGFD